MTTKRKSWYSKWGIDARSIGEPANRALESAHVALVAGSAFGAEGYARLSFAADLSNLDAGLDRLAEFLKG